MNIFLNSLIEMGFSTNYVKIGYSLLNPENRFEYYDS